MSFGTYNYDDKYLLSKVLNFSNGFYYGDLINYENFCVLIPKITLERPMDGLIRSSDGLAFSADDFEDELKPILYSQYTGIVNYEFSFVNLVDIDSEFRDMLDDIGALDENIIPIILKKNIGNFFTELITGENVYCGDCEDETFLPIDIDFTEKYRLITYGKKERFNNYLKQIMENGSYAIIHNIHFNFYEINDDFLHLYKDVTIPNYDKILKILETYFRKAKEVFETAYLKQINDIKNNYPDLILYDFWEILNMNTEIINEKIK